MACSRPDISYSVGLLSMFMHEPRELAFLKRLLKYLKATQDLNLVYTKSTDKSIELTRFTDSEYAGHQDDRKSNSGYILKYGNCFV